MNSRSIELIRKSKPLIAASATAATAVLVGTALTDTSTPTHGTLRTKLSKPFEPEKHPGIDRVITRGNLVQRQSTFRPRFPPFKRNEALDPVAVTGASGNLGSKIVDSFIKRGQPVVAYVSRAPERYPGLYDRPGVTVVQVDMSDAKKGGAHSTDYWKEQHEKHGFGTVVNCAGTSYSSRANIEQNRPLRNINTCPVKAMARAASELSTQTSSSTFNIIQIGSQAAKSRRTEYGSTKADAQEGLKFTLGENKKAKYATLNLGLAFDSEGGVRHDLSPDQMVMMRPFLERKFRESTGIDAKIPKGITLPIVIPGEGKVNIPLVGMDDVVSGVVNLSDELKNKKSKFAGKAIDAVSETVNMKGLMSALSESANERLAIVPMGTNTVCDNSMKAILSVCQIGALSMSNVKLASPTEEEQERLTPDNKEFTELLGREPKNVLEIITKNPPKDEPEKIIDFAKDVMSQTVPAMNAAILFAALTPSLAYAAVMTPSQGERYDTRGEAVDPNKFSYKKLVRTQQLKKELESQTPSRG